MRRSRFSEKQIIGVLKGAPGGPSGGGALPHGDQRRDILHVALEVRQPRGLRCETPEGARGGEPQAQEAAP